MLKSQTLCVSNQTASLRETFFFYFFFKLIYILQVFHTLDFSCLPQLLTRAKIKKKCIVPLVDLNLCGSLRLTDPVETAPAHKLILPG